jgi:hypothetical protein
MLEVESGDSGVSKFPRFRSGGEEIPVLLRLINWQKVFIFTKVGVVKATCDRKRN